MDKVFLDTNIALDAIALREPYWKEALMILDLSARKKIKAYVSSISIATISFLLRENYDAREVRNKLLHLLRSVEPLPTDKEALEQALLDDFKDIEDCIQYFTAMENGCVVLTRDRDFLKHFPEKTISPREYLEGIR